MASVLHALSDRVRLSIVRRLASGADVASVRSDFAVAKSTMSHHFRVLREAGLTHTRVENGRHLVTLRRDELDEHLPGLLDVVLALAEGE